MFKRSRTRSLTELPAGSSAGNHSRRGFLRAAGGAGLVGLLGGVGARLEAGTSVAKALPAAAAQRSRQVAMGVLAQRPRWASWNVDELNAGRDGWNEPGAWLSRILNRRRLGQQYENFPNTSNARHHWGMVVDLRKCIGCHACTVACKSENNVPPGVFRTWVQVVETGDMRPDAAGDVITDTGRYECSVSRSPLPRLCNHCDNPPCVVVCPVEATFKRSDGPVLIDPTKCIGCGICIQSCPYDARYFHTVQQTADKCTFCVHRLDRGELPACVTSCVGRARVFGDLNNPDTAVSRLIAGHSTERLLEYQGTDPQVFYIDLNGQLEIAATAFDTIYPYAVSTNTDEYDDLTGKVLLQTPTGPAS
jgi:Fe-S-cluster-containing dehydrogenase component